MTEEPNLPEVLMIDVDAISPNSWNPNELDEAKFENLVETFRKEGVVNQTILVRPDKEEGRYVIIDGEHRWKGAKAAGLQAVLCIVVTIDDTEAQVKTLSFNAIRGQNVPLKLAKIVAGLQRQYSNNEIRRLTGIDEGEQATVLKLLDAPALRITEGPKLKEQKATAEPSLTGKTKDLHIVLMPHEEGAYTAAMKRAMKDAGEEMTPLIGQEVKDFNKALGASMGIAGVKLRNMALAAICQAYLDMPEDQRRKAIDKISGRVIEKRTSDATARVEQRIRSDKPPRTRKPVAKPIEETV